MDFIYSSNPIQSAADLAADSIIHQLDSKKTVLWLLTGGSGLNIAIIAMSKLKEHDLSRLTISLTDERYGDIGHKDENWQQLVNAGFEANGAKIYRPLKNLDINQTTAEFNKWIKKQLKKNKFKIGLFGIGTDSHTAGIKPYSKAATSDDFVECFSGEDFDRISITFNTIKKLDQAIIQVSGADKKHVIKQLLTENLDTFTNPSQILKQVNKSTLFSDNKQEEL